MLLTSYTHSAVDNILLKLLDISAAANRTPPAFLRLGNVDKVHPAVRPYSDATDPPETVAELAQLYASRPVVATTCLGINQYGAGQGVRPLEARLTRSTTRNGVFPPCSPLFAKRRFDYCIVDEASQVTLPVCLGPLQYADVFVLVGDHYQLPPLVRCCAACRGLGRPPD